MFSLSKTCLSSFVLLLSFLTIINTIMNILKSGSEYYCVCSRKGFLINSFSEDFNVSSNGCIDGSNSCFDGDKFRVESKKMTKMIEGLYQQSMSCSIIKNDIETKKSELIIKEINNKNGTITMNKITTEHVWYPISNLSGQIDLNKSYCKMEMNFYKYEELCSISKNFQDSIFIIFLISSVLSITALIASQFEMFLTIRILLKRTFIYFEIEDRGVLSFCNERSGSFTKIPKGREIFILQSGKSKKSLNPKFKDDCYSLFVKNRMYKLFRNKLIIIQNEKTEFIEREIEENIFQELIFYMQSLEIDYRNLTLIKTKNNWHSLTFLQIFNELTCNGKCIGSFLSSKEIIALNPFENEIDSLFEIYDEDILDIKSNRQKDKGAVKFMIKHNKNFFSKTKGDLKSLTSAMKGRRGWWQRPEGVKNSQWKMYVSDFNHICDYFKINLTNDIKYQKKTEAFHKTMEEYDSAPEIKKILNKTDFKINFIDKVCSHEMTLKNSDKSFKLTDFFENENIIKKLKEEIKNNNVGIEINDNNDDNNSNNNSLEIEEKEENNNKKDVNKKIEQFKEKNKKKKNNESVGEKKILLLGRYKNEKVEGYNYAKFKENKQKELVNLNKTIKIDQNVKTSLSNLFKNVINNKISSSIFKEKADFLKNDEKAQLSFETLEEEIKENSYFIEDKEDIKDLNHRSWCKLYKKQYKKSKDGLEKDKSILKEKKNDFLKTLEISNYYEILRKSNIDNPYENKVKEVHLNDFSNFDFLKKKILNVCIRNEMEPYFKKNREFESYFLKKSIKDNVFSEKIDEVFDTGFENCFEEIDDKEIMKKINEIRVINDPTLEKDSSKEEEKEEGEKKRRKKEEEEEKERKRKEKKKTNKNVTQFAEEIYDKFVKQMNDKEEKLKASESYKENLKSIRNKGNKLFLKKSIIKDEFKSKPKINVYPFDFLLIKTLKENNIELGVSELKIRNSVFRKMKNGKKSNEKLKNELKNNDDDNNKKIWNDAINIVKNKFENCSNDIKLIICLLFFIKREDKELRSALRNYEVVLKKGEISGNKLIEKIIKL